MPQALLLANVLLLLACGCAAPDPRPSPSMAQLPLELVVTPPAKPFVAGSQLPVVVTVRNSGNAGVSLPQPGTLSPLLYRLYHADGRVAVELSERLAKTAVGGDSLQPEPEMEVGPRGSLTYQEDLSEYRPQPIAPGRYELEAALIRAEGAAVSKRVSIEILPLTPQILLRVSDDSGARLDTLVLNSRPTPQVLFGLGGWPEPAPRALRALTAPGGAPLAGIALAVDAEPSGAFRWVAWLQDGRLNGGMARQHDLKFPFESQPSGLENPRLLSRAFQYPDGRGVFLLLGTTRGRIALELVQVRGETSPAASVITIEGAPPSAPFVAWSRSDQKLHLYWVGEAGTGSQLFEAGVDPKATATTIAARVVQTMGGNPTALRVPPVLGTDGAQIEWLEVGTALPVVRRISHVGKLENPIPLPAAPNFDLKTVRRWIVPEWGTSLADTLVAVGETDTWLLRAGAWSRLASFPSANAALFPLAGDKLMLGWWAGGGTGSELIELK